MPFLGKQPSRGLVGTTDIDTNAIDGTFTKDALVGDYSDVTITAADLIMYGDATDSNNTKRDTVQGVLDLASSGLKFIGSTDISGAATYAFTAVVAASYEMYLISFDNIIPATDSVALEMRTSSNAGSSYDSGASDYGFGMDYKGVYTSDKADDSLALIPNAGSLSGFGAVVLQMKWALVELHGFMRPIRQPSHEFHGIYILWHMMAQYTLLTVEE